MYDNSSINKQNYKKKVTNVCSKDEIVFFYFWVFESIT